MEEKNIEDQVFDWVMNITPNITDNQSYCKTRDIFQGRLEKATNLLLKDNKISVDDIYIASAIVGEIGNNSFDHNLGNWPNVTGIFFNYKFENNKLSIVLADRGRGLYKTLKKVKPEIKNDEDALFTAFNEKISGRAPESRGNGLKFVKESIKNKKMHLSFYSGNAKVELNDDMKISQSNQQINGCLAIISI